jgi:molybdopterin-guanine dinucleotide biosynthesis protein A
VIADLLTSYGGPLAGVAAAIAALSANPPDLLLTVAVDTPFFPADFPQRAIAMLEGGRDVIVAAFDGQDYPTNAVWRFGALTSLPARIIDGTAPHGLRRLIAAHNSAMLDYGGLTAENPFANANTPEDLAALRGAADTGKRG